MPDLEDWVIAAGNTREEAIRNFRDALLNLLDYKRDQGQNTPPVTALEVRELREVETLETRLTNAA